MNTICSPLSLFSLSGIPIRYMLDFSIYIPCLLTSLLNFLSANYFSVCVLVNILLFIHVTLYCLSDYLKIILDFGALVFMLSISVDFGSQWIISLCILQLGIIRGNFFPLWESRQPQLSKNPSNVFLFASSEHPRANCSLKAILHFFFSWKISHTMNAV